MPDLRTSEPDLRHGSRRRAVLSFLFFGIFLLTPPSNLPSAAALEIEPGDAEELARLEELARWIDPTATTYPLAEAIRERRDSFDAFRRLLRGESLAEGVDELPFGPSIRRSAERYGVDPLLLASIVEVESRFDPRAVSQRGATGLMQVLPSTAGAASRSELYDPQVNLDAGARYLRRLLRRFDGDLALALAAYNAGPTAVRRYGGVPPYRETRSYVEQVLRIYLDHLRQLWRRGEPTERLAML